ncbi:metal ABC transporter solute-binding protein, Zn/Mn family [Nesterenkonia rhizosphaerae]|uniref:Zinc ABC transporter substrate-binding protein n=1 Tax=Nesterenkonia rhizosphaerae TaxID=1348272 RepID=A0ABP9FZ82_9MICC
MRKNTSAPSRALRSLGLGGVVVLLAASCGAEDAPASEPQDGVETDLLIVTSIDVYADLATEVVGDTAEVQALVDNPAVDPHSYEATPQDRLVVNQADVIIANGGGYDSFITLLASAADADDSVYQLIDGENHHSHEWDGSYENEHIWYDLEYMSAFVTDFGEYMGELVPENAELYTENAQALAGEIDELDERNRAIEAEGMSYLATEAVSGFLLQDAGFEDLTELQFLSAVEHGDDVSPRLYQQALNVATGDEIDLLAYNPQTETNQSARIRQAAEDSGVSVLEFSETFPDGFDSYTEWMSENISTVEALVEDLRG